MRFWVEKRFDGKKQLTTLNKEHLMTRLFIEYLDPKIRVDDAKSSRDWAEDVAYNADGQPIVKDVNLRCSIDRGEDIAYVRFDRNETREIYNVLRDAYVARKGAKTLEENKKEGGPRPTPSTT